ncbi:hypothetical protein [Prosthecobacter dejongeii]|uniref:Uncharacterized protein n=1 Tax=Prosthecobacter dejongeii TaxID=48465 RepID=A0A7W8DNR1_9BACT|nr:hypothetical protein [Prosthecobacter dejongeii]MBB5036365.1 hypothetical protein [Prosthecobacter dejongeii]
MAPNSEPVKPAPVAPVSHIQELKFMPVLMSVVVLRFFPLLSQKPLRLLATDTFLPHCPPALALHCALLI